MVSRPNRIVTTDVTGWMGVVLKHGSGGYAAFGWPGSVRAPRVDVRRNPALLKPKPCILHHTHRRNRIVRESPKKKGIHRPLFWWFVLETSVGSPEIVCILETKCAQASIPPAPRIFGWWFSARKKTSRFFWSRSSNGACPHSSYENEVQSVMSTQTVCGFDFFGKSDLFGFVWFRFS